MFKLCKIALISFFLLGSSLVAAQGKIAVLDIDAAIINTNEAQNRLKSLREQPTFKANTQELEKLKQDYDGIIKQLQKDLAVMSNDQKEAQRKKIEEKRSDIEHVVRKLRVSEQEVLQTLVQEMGPRLQQAVNDLIKSENIGLLLDRKAAMHVDSGYNITAKVTEQLNKGQ